MGCCYAAASPIYLTIAHLFFVYFFVVVVVSVERVLYCNYCHHCNYTFKGRPVVVRPIHVQGMGEMKTWCSWETSREKAKSVWQKKEKSGEKRGKQ